MILKYLYKYKLYPLVCKHANIMGWDAYMWGCSVRWCSAEFEHIHVVVHVHAYLPVEYVIYNSCIFIFKLDLWFQQYHCNLKYKIVI